MIIKRGITINILELIGLHEGEKVEVNIQESHHNTLKLKNSATEGGISN